jgi:4-amino-4-deoxy-L-arabinose transferase-like glycosyltransferase
MSSGAVDRTMSGAGALATRAARSGARGLLDRVAASRWALSGFVLLAVLFRAWWGLARPAVMENEGAEYARIAENLLAGHGYVGTMAGPQTLFPPLYPLLIALVLLAIDNAEVAGRVVSVVAGALLVVPVFLMALHLYGRRVAFIAAAFIVLNPALISFSVSVYSEGPALMLLLCGAYCGLRALELKGVKHPALAGTFLGLSYLVRPETILFVVLAMAAVLVISVAKKAELRRALQSLAAMAVPVILLALPYVHFLYRHSGTLHLEGKSSVNYTIGQRINGGMSFDQAAFGIDHRLREAPLLNPKAYLNGSPYRRTPGELARYLATAAKRNVRRIGRALLSDRNLGAPLLPFLALFALFRSPWSRDRAVQEGFLIMIFLGMVAALLTVQHFWDRFLFPFVPFLVLWSAKGLDEFYGWLQGTLASVRRSKTSPHPLWLGALCGVTAAAIAVTGRPSSALVSGEALKKKAGLWLRRHHPGPKRIMEAGTVIPYYAGGDWMPLPYADPVLALRYIEAKRPDYVVLVDTPAAQRAYVKRWARGGIPDARARLLHRLDGASGDQVVIYGWGNGYGP